MHVIVCVKQVPDPEIPPSSFKVDEAAKKVVPPPGVAAVVSQFDEIAVEAAMRIKDAQSDAKVTVLSMGPASAYDAIKKGLAMGSDEGVHLLDDAFEDGDAYTTAQALAAAIQKLGDYDLILCGRQAVDWDMGVTGSALAEVLGIPSITFAKDVQVRDGSVVVERVFPDSFETVEASLPALVTISNELGEPRYPKLQQIMQAARKQVTKWSAADLGLDPSQLGASGVRLSLDRLYVPVSEIECEFVEGETPEEAAQKLAEKLRESKLV